MNKPVRVQLRRSKSWKMPPNTVKVDRSTKWGNPYHVGQRGRLVWEPMADADLLTQDFSRKDIVCPDGVVIKGARRVPPNRLIYFDAPLTIEDVILLYRKHIIENKIDVAPLRGKNLACWCKLDQPCHADVLLEIANPEATP
jgi:hypothetical protein